jgi:hypothetical protein
MLRFEAPTDILIEVHLEPLNTTMETVRNYAHWFILGMGNVLGIGPLLAPSEGSELEAIGRDFRAVGDDLRHVMRRVPPTADSAIKLGAPEAQLELSGIK